MKVADEGIIGFEHRAGPLGGMRGAMRSAGDYPRENAATAEQEHDARGLLIAIGLCVCCWLGLGYFLLT